MHKGQWKRRKRSTNSPQELGKHKSEKREGRALPAERTEGTKSQGHETRCEALGWTT